jgi:hypothetical protein
VRRGGRVPRDPASKRAFVLVRVRLAICVQFGHREFTCSWTEKTEDRSMPGSVFKIVVDGGDWGSPMANETTFDSLEEAQAEARSYLEQQGRAGASLSVTRRPRRMARS